jgi:malonate-semialdehyde dehydrogenase (acetylating)/methylmalonate-semialdehyde dehydrogenase
MGPLISAESKRRVEDLLKKGVSGGAKVLVDGRDAQISGYEKGNFIRPTIIESPNDDELASTEIFGPVLTVRRAANLEEAIALLARSPYGNAASIFTTNGASARQFRYEAPAGNIGVNIGVAAPMAYFPFSGWKDSFLGVIHGQGADAVEFYTDKKVVIERWPKEWSRKF